MILSLDAERNNKRRLTHTEEDDRRYKTQIEVIKFCANLGHSRHSARRRDLIDSSTVTSLASEKERGTKKKMKKK